MLAGVLLYEFELAAQQKTIQRVVVGVDTYRAHLGRIESMEEVGFGNCLRQTPSAISSHNADSIDSVDMPYELQI